MSVKSVTPRRPTMPMMESLDATRRANLDSTLDNKRHSNIDIAQKLNANRNEEPAFIGPGQYRNLKASNTL